MIAIGNAIMNVAQTAIALDIELFLSSISTSRNNIAIGNTIIPIQCTSVRRLSISINDTEIIIKANGPNRLDLASGP